MMGAGGAGNGGSRRITLFLAGDSISSWWVYGRAASGFETHPRLVSVGSVGGPLPVSPAKPTLDRFEGHGGTSSAVFLANMPTWYGRAPADLVLLQIGVAEYYLGQTDPNVYAITMRDIVDTCLAINPAARFFVARITNARSDMTGFNATVVAFRAALSAILASYPEVTMVDLPVLVDAEMEDTIHPLPIVGGAGYVALANAWYAALVAGGAL